MREDFSCPRVKSKFLDELEQILYSDLYSHPNRAGHEGKLLPMPVTRSSLSC
jgi:hypothetical protein